MGLIPIRLMPEGGPYMGLENQILEGLAKHIDAKAKESKEHLNKGFAMLNNRILELQGIKKTVDALTLDLVTFKKELHDQPAPGDINEEVERIDGEFSELSSSVDGITDNLEDLDNKVDDLDTDHSELVQDVEALRKEVAELKTHFATEMATLCKSIEAISAVIKDSIVKQGNKCATS